MFFRISDFIDLTKDVFFAVFYFFIFYLMCYLLWAFLDFYALVFIGVILLTNNIFPAILFFFNWYQFPGKFIFGFNLVWRNSIIVS